MVCAEHHVLYRQKTNTILCLAMLFKILVGLLFVQSCVPVQEVLANLESHRRQVGNLLGTTQHLRSKSQDSRRSVELHERVERLKLGIEELLGRLEKQREALWAASIKDVSQWPCMT